MDVMDSQFRSRPLRFCERGDGLLMVSITFSIQPPNSALIRGCHAKERTHLQLLNKMTTLQTKQREIAGNI